MSSKTGKKFDTSNLKKLIKAKGFTINKLRKEVAGLCDSTEGAINGHLHGWAEFTKDEITAIAMIMEVPEEEIKKRITPNSEAQRVEKDAAKGPRKDAPSFNGKTEEAAQAAKPDKEDTVKKDGTPSLKPADNAPASKVIPQDYYKANYDALERARIRKGLTQQNIETAIGQARNFYYRMKNGTRVTGETASKIAKLLDANFNELFIRTNLFASNTMIINGTIYYQPDIEAIDKAIKDKGMTVAETFKMIGCSEDMYNEWKKGRMASALMAESVARALDTDLESLFKSSKTPEKKNETGKEVKPDVFAAPELKSTENVFSTFDLFSIINENMQTTLNTLSSQIKADNAATERSLEAKFDRITNELVYLKAEISKIAVRLIEMDEKREKAEAAKTIVSINNKKSDLQKRLKPLDPEDVQYNPKDSFQDYSHKINSMVYRIAQDTQMTKDSVLFRFYKEMEKYGVKWDVLKSDYKRKNGTSQSHQMVLLHDNDMYGEIFFHIIQDEYLTGEKLNKKYV